MIILKGKDLADLTEFRTYLDLLPKDSDIKSDQKYIDTMNRFQAWCTKAGANISDYVLDMWAGVIFTKAEHKAGEMLNYRKSIGLK